MPYRCFVAIALVVISVVTAGCGGGYRTPRQQAAQHGPRAAMCHYFVHREYFPENFPKIALIWYHDFHRFVANQVRLALSVLAYSLGNFLRRLALSASIGHWFLRSIQVKRIRIGAKVIHHARYIIFQSRVLLAK